ncbi:MAG: hypothetical protein AB1439_07060 [candidate division FCPU426 bacterium]
MATSKQQPTSESPLQCTEHNQPGKWKCGVCGQPVCGECNPVAFSYQVFHPRCLPEAHRRQEQSEVLKREPEAPSAGLKTVAWSFMVAGIVLFGVALFLFGISLFSQAVPIRAIIAGTVAPSLDSIPGSRMLLNWTGAVCLAISAGVFILGVGLLNCVAASRRLVLFLAWLEVLAAGLGWLVVLGLGHGFWDIPVIGLLLIVFFSRPSVKRQFEKVL